MPTPKQQYTAESRQDAVRLVESMGKSCAQIARNLSVPAHSVVRWKQQQEVQCVKGRPMFTGLFIVPCEEQHLS